MAEPKTAFDPVSGSWAQFIDGEWVLTGTSDPRDRSMLEEGLASTGREFARIGRGIKQLGGMLNPHYNQAALDQSLREEAAEEAMLFRVGEENNPGSHLVGAIAPYLATAPLSGGLAAQTAIGAGLGAVSGAGGEEGIAGAPKGAAFGAGGSAVGHVVAKGIGRAVGRGGRMSERVQKSIGDEADQLDQAAAQAARAERGAPDNPDPFSDPNWQQKIAEGRFDEADAIFNTHMEQAPQGVGGTGAFHDRMVASAEELKIPITRGTASGSSRTRRLEARAQSHPLTSEAYDDIAQRAKSQITELQARGMGMQGLKTLDDGNMGRAHDAIAGRMNAIQEALPEVRLSTADVQALTQIGESGANHVVRPKPTGAIIQRLLERGQPDGMGNVVMTGKDFARVRSQISRAMSDNARAASPDADYVELLGETVSVLDNAFARSADEAAAGLLGAPPRPELFGLANAAQRTREQWKLWRTLLPPGSRDPAGMVNPASASTRAARNFRREFAQDEAMRMQNTSPELRDALEALRVGRWARDIVPDSGTATRSASVPDTLYGALTATAARPASRILQAPAGAGQGAAQAAQAAPAPPGFGQAGAAMGRGGFIGGVNAETGEPASRVGAHLDPSVRPGGLLP